MQVQLATKISPETYQALDRYAKASGRSKSSIIEEALRRYITEQTEQSKRPPIGNASG